MFVCVCKERFFTTSGENFIHGETVVPLKEQTVWFRSSWFVDVHSISILSFSRQSTASGPTVFIDKVNSGISRCRYVYNNTCVCDGDTVGEVERVCHVDL